MIEASGAQLHELKTTKDGGWRVVIDFPGDEVNSMAMLALSTMRDKSLTVKVDDAPQP